MTSSTINLPQLLADLDALRIEALPLEEHSVARFDTHIREAYATQLATLMLIESTPSDNQARLFNQLLDALQLGSDASARLLQLAQQTNQQSLREFLKLVEEHRLEASFIVDGLVLCRLDAPLSETQSQVFSEYTQLMQVQESDLARYAHLAAQVLGLPSDYELPSNFDFNGYKLRVWKEFFYRELTQEMLDEGVDLDNGLWVIKKALTARSFNINDGSIRWDGKEAHLNVTYAFKLINCLVVNPVVEASSEVSIRLDDCKIKGQQPLEREVTAFTFGSGDIIINKSNISLINTRVISKERSDGRIVILDSEFYCCGHPSLDGGILQANGGFGSCKLKISNSSFLKCIAKNGAVAFSRVWDRESSIINCKFNLCFSGGFDSQSALDNPEEYIAKSTGFDMENLGRDDGWQYHLELKGNQFSLCNIKTDKIYGTVADNKLENSFLKIRNEDNFNRFKSGFAEEKNDFGRDLIINQ